MRYATAPLAGLSLLRTVAPHQAIIIHMLLTDFLPTYDHMEAHSIRVQAGPQRCFHAVKDLTLSELSPVAHLLFALRALPSRLTGQGGQKQLTATEPVLEQILSRGFVRLAEDNNHEIVLGTVGRFWQLAGGSCLHLESPQAFLTFNQPGYAKAAMNFYFHRHGIGSTIVSTETRIYATDAVARRKFFLYWRIVYPGSALIRKMWLKAIKRRAEQEFDH